MILLGLLLALICIVIGIVAEAAPWFIGSLVASAIAGLLLWYRRNQTGAESPMGASFGAQPSDDSATGDQVWVVDGRPTYHAYCCAVIADQPAERIPLSQAHEDGFIPCSVCTPSAAIT